MKKYLFLAIALFFSTLTLVNAQSLSQMKAPPRKMPKMDANNILNVEDFEKLLLKSANRVIIDLRSSTEFEAGRLDGAVNLNPTDSTTFNDAIKAINNKAVVFIYGANKKGAKVETPIIQKVMNTNNPNVYYLDGGFEAWKKKNKPVFQVATDIGGF